MNEITIKNILTEELFGFRICESVEDKEIVDFFYSELLLEKFLWGEPISVPELRKLLRKKIVNFEFIKLDGEVRPAKGTTMMKYVPKEDQPKGIRPSSDNVATFYDLDKDAWRSVSKKSKEIVLKKDEEKNRPVIVVKDKDEKLKKKGVDIDKLGPEPTDELAVGDIRNYLNRNGKNVIIKITRIDDDGSIYAETVKGKTRFYLPAARIKNIGEKVKPTDKGGIPPTTPVRPPKLPQGPPPAPMAQPAPGTEAPSSKGKGIEERPIEEPTDLSPVTPETPEGEAKEVIELIPKEETEEKEPPEEVDDRDDAEELIK